MEFKPYIHHAKDLESAVLGQCLLENLAMGRTLGLISPETFYLQANQAIYQALQQMYERSLPIDLLTVTEYLINQKQITDFAGVQVAGYLAGLTSAVVSTAHLEYHCHLLTEMWKKREILKLKFSPIQTNDPRENLAWINAELTRIAGQQIKREWMDMEELMFNLMVHQSEMASGKKTFVTTGFKKVDQLNGGFYNGQMVVIGARPSVGKSALMGQMAIKMAQSGKKVGIISLEMNNQEIAARLASLETGIDFNIIFRSIMHDEQLHRRFYEKISRSTIKLPIFLSDKTKVNITEIRAKAMKLKAAKGCDCIMVDYLQLIDGSTNNKQYNREQEVANMSRGLKLLAQELDIPVIVLCQLNRAVTSRSRADRFPKLSDLRESGAIEQDADVAMFIHRDYTVGILTDEEGNSTEYSADLIGPKWRNGATFHLQLDFDPPKMQFTEKAGAAETYWRPVPELKGPLPIEKEDESPF